MNIFSLPSPHQDKLVALLQNPKLPASDRPRVKSAIGRYESWIFQLSEICKETSNRDLIVSRMVSLLDGYRTYLDMDLIFDSEHDFLYRQKGQLKLDNSVIEEFLPILIKATLTAELAKLDGDVDVGPTNSFSAIHFESSLNSASSGGGMNIRSKDQDFAISRKLFIQTSHFPDFRLLATRATALAYLAAEIKTNLDKTMFQEAAATALDLKTLIPGSRYYLLCEWLDMTPIGTDTTAIDEILVLRKSKRLSSNVRSSFGTVSGRKENSQQTRHFLRDHPFSSDVFRRFVSHVDRIIQSPTEQDVLTLGYF